MSMMPKTSVSPAARRNSISPNCRLFSDCSRNRITVTEIGLLPRFSALLHRRVVVCPVFHGRARAGVDLLVDDAALVVLGEHAQVVVLHRCAVVSEFPVAAR